MKKIIRYKLIVSYDGSTFEGWQSQPSKNSVQDLLIQTFIRVFKTKIWLIGASRTDAGVHALGQVVLCKFQDFGLEKTKLLKVWNTALPAAIKIISASKAIHDFHPHHNVEQKIYVYRIFLQKPSPFEAKMGWFFPLIHKVDFVKFFKCLAKFEGSHDFKLFCKEDLASTKSTKKTIFAIKTKQSKRAVDVFISAKGFLRYQIRRIIGAAIEFSMTGKFDLAKIRQALQTPSKELVGQIPSFCAAPHGLCLKKIIYSTGRSKNKFSTIHIEHKSHFMPNP